MQRVAVLLSAATALLSAAAKEPSVPLCNRGEYFHKGRMVCITCPVGKFNPHAHTPAARCSRCAYATATGSWKCRSKCGAGTYERSVAMFRGCVNCPRGKYNPCSPGYGADMIDVDRSIPLAAYADPATQAALQNSTFKCMPDKFASCIPCHSAVAGSSKCAGMVPYKTPCGFGTFEKTQGGCGVCPRYHYNPCGIGHGLLHHADLSDATGLNPARWADRKCVPGVPAVCGWCPFADWPGERQCRAVASCPKGSFFDSAAPLSFSADSRGGGGGGGGGSGERKELIAGTTVLVATADGSDRPGGLSSSSVQCRFCPAGKYNPCKERHGLKLVAPEDSNTESGDEQPQYVCIQNEPATCEHCSSTGASTGASSAKATGRTECPARAPYITPCGAGKYERWEGAAGAGDSHCVNCPAGKYGPWCPPGMCHGTTHRHPQSR